MSQNQEKLPPVFIHSKLDDYGLTPAQFRIYGHLSRREGKDGAWASVASMARFCHMEVKTVRKCLKDLLSFGMINRQERPGDSSVYRLTAISEWVEPLPKNTSGAKRQHTPANQRHSLPSQTAPDKGNPSEGYSK